MLVVSNENDIIKVIRSQFINIYSTKENMRSGTKRKIKMKVNTKTIGVELVFLMYAKNEIIGTIYIIRYELGGFTYDTNK